MGYTFDIGIWLTADLRNNGVGDPETALDRFVTETFDETSHSVDLTIHSESIVPPNENCVDDGWPVYEEICGFGGQTYTDLLDWWTDKHGCNGYEDHTDANLLVTNYPSTYGITGPGCDIQYCVAEASDIGLLASESFNNEGPELRYSQMYATVLHELGHAAIDENLSVSCGGSPAEEEWMGDSWSAVGNTYTSPMVTWRDDTGTQNECCTNVEFKPSEIYFSRSYSQCVASHMKNCANR